MKIHKLNWDKLEGLDMRQIFGAGIFSGLLMGGLMAMIVSSFTIMWWVMLVAGIISFAGFGSLATYLLLWSLEDIGL